MRFPYRFWVPILTWLNHNVRIEIIFAIDFHLIKVWPWTELFSERCICLLVNVFWFGMLFFASSFLMDFHIVLLYHLKRMMFNWFLKLFNISFAYLFFEDFTVLQIFQRFYVDKCPNHILQLLRLEYLNDRMDGIIAKDKFIVWVNTWSFRHLGWAGKQNEIFEKLEAISFPSEDQFEQYFDYFGSLLDGLAKNAGLRKELYLAEFGCEAEKIHGWKNVFCSIFLFFKFLQIFYTLIICNEYQYKTNKSSETNLPW